jgi:hypothetical protein
VKIFIETSSTEFSLPNFSGVNDTAEINVTPLKSQTDFTKLHNLSFFKGKIQQKYFNGKYTHTVQVEAEKSWGLPRPNFRCQRCQ